MSIRAGPSVGGGGGGGDAPVSSGAFDNIANRPGGVGAGAATSGFQACAACKHQRRKCTPECPLAPYFPVHMTEKFQNAQRFFGVSNIVKFIKSVPEDQRLLAVNNLIAHSEARQADPVMGIVGVIARLRGEILAAERERDFVRRQLQECRLRERGNQPPIKLEGVADHFTAPMAVVPISQLPLQQGGGPHPKSPTIFHLPVERFDVKDMKKQNLSPVCDEQMAEYMNVKSPYYRSPNPCGSQGSDQAQGYSVDCSLRNAYSPNVGSSQEGENDLASKFLYKS